MVHEQEVVEFYTNLEIIDGLSVSSEVRRVPIVFGTSRLGHILGGQAFG